MNSRPNSRLPLLALALVASGSLVAADRTDSPVAGPYRISVNTRFFFNVSAEVVHPGGGPDLTGPAGVGGVDRRYDDGAVLRDISNNAGGQTWNWEFKDPAQLIGAPLATAIEMHRTVGPRTGTTSDLGTDPSFGGEIGWSWEISRFDLGKREARAGLDIFAGWNQVSGSGNSVATGTQTRQTDLFAVAPGDVLPVLPTAGTFAGPGPRIADSPTRSTAAVAASSQFNGNMDATMIGFRVGPWIEIPLTRKLTLSAGLGLSAVHVDGTFSFAEQMTLAGVPQAVVAASVDRADWKSGFYIDSKLNWNLNAEWSVFVGAQFQHLGTFKIDALGRQGKVGLESAIGITAGVGFSF